MTKRIGRRFGLSLGIGVLLGSLGSPGCSDSQDFSSSPKAKASKDDIQKAEFERDKAAKAGKPAKKVP
jgi:hypothetical protein